MSDTQIKLATLRTTRDLKSIIDWANECIEDAAAPINADEEWSDTEAKRDRIKADRAKRMETAIKDALDEINMAGLAYSHDVLKGDMVCEAIGDVVDQFCRNSHVEREISYRSTRTGLTSRMHEHGGDLIFALREGLRQRRVKGDAA